MEAYRDIPANKNREMLLFETCVGRESSIHFEEGLQEKSYPRRGSGLSPSGLEAKERLRDEMRM